MRPKAAIKAAIKGGFNPRTRKGCDYAGFNELVAGMRFQSTHP